MILDFLKTTTSSWLLTDLHMGSIIYFIIVISFSIMPVVVLLTATNLKGSNYHHHTESSV